VLQRDVQSGQTHACNLLDVRTEPIFAVHDSITQRITQAFLQVMWATPGKAISVPQWALARTRSPNASVEVLKERQS